MADRQRWLLEQLGLKLAEVTESMLGSAVTAALETRTPIPDADADADLLAWEQGFDLGTGCRVFVAASSAAWNRIGGEALRAAGVEELDPDSVHGTYLEILSQALSALASDLGGLLARNVSPVDGRETPYSSEVLSQAIEVVFNGEPVTLFTGIDPRLLAAIEFAEAAPDAKPPSDAEPPLRPAPVRDEAVEAERSDRQDLLDGSKTLDLLLDVELPVSVSFGRASVPLKDVLKLTSGSIVELNRGVSDPVELIVNNCVIARGEVVVVEGNYGVRIQQIISARERLRTLN